MTMQGLSKTARRAAAGVTTTGIAVALMLAAGPGTARADVIDELANEFTTASGAGPVANLVNQSLRLKAAGFRPTAGELTAITQAETYRPNQTPLIKALQETVAGQTKLQQMAQATQGQNGFSIGINQYDPNNPGGLTAGPGGVNLGGGSNQYTIGRPNS